MNRPAPFRQVDVMRALKAAKAAGLNVSRCEISPDGTIVLVNDVCAVHTAANEAEAAFARWEAQHGETEQGRGFSYKQNTG